jgi:hypothetical protein
VGEIPTLFSEIWVLTAFGRQHTGIALREIFPLLFCAKTADNLCKISVKTIFVCDRRTCKTINYMYFDSIDIVLFDRKKD